MIPYIGITGVTHQYQTSAILDGFPANARHKMMIGLLASGNTIWGIPNKYSRQYPQPHELGNVFIDHPQALNLVHFNQNENGVLFKDLMWAQELAGPYCHGFQLNIAWPDPEVVADLKSQRMTVVLQIGRRAFEMINHSPLRLGLKVKREYPMVDYVILDASGGEGKALDVCFVRPYFYALETMNLPIGFVVGGGLGPNSLDLAAPLIDEFPDLSIDAQKKLRDANDDLHIPSALLYRDKALAMFER